MDKQPDDHVLQERGCKAVKLLASQMHDKVTVAVGGLKTMTNVLSRHKDNPKIAIRALGAVRVMLANPDNANAADISTILQLVPSCMHRMQEDPGLAKQGCSFMRTVAKYENFQESINVAGGVEATICVLKNNRLNISVQKEGWNALVSLFVLPGNISNAHRSGVVWVLVSTILEHIGNDKLQELLCLVMRILSVHASLLSEIHHSGGLEAVLQVASEHIDRGQVTQHVLATLVNLVSGEGCSQFFEQNNYSGPSLSPVWPWNTTTVVTNWLINSKQAHLRAFCQHSRPTSSSWHVKVGICSSQRFCVACMNRERQYCKRNIAASCVSWR